MPRAVGGWHDVFRGGVTFEAILDEIAKAETFLPKLAKFFVVTSAEAHVEEQEELRIELARRRPPFEVHVMFWGDVCRAITHDLVRKYWSAWFDTVPACGPYRPEPRRLVEPTVEDVIMSVAPLTFAESWSKATEPLDMEELKERVLRAVDADETVSRAAVAASTTADQVVHAFLRQQAEAWERGLATIANQLPHDPGLELTFLGSTDEAELDVGLRNLSPNDAIIDRVTVTVLKDRNYVAPMLMPSARYKVPVGDLGVGESRSIEIRHVVEARKADRLLVDVDDLRTLLLHVELRTNGGYGLSGTVWLFGDDEDD